LIEIFAEPSLAAIVGGKQAFCETDLFYPVSASTPQMGEAQIVLNRRGFKSL